MNTRNVKIIFKNSYRFIGEILFALKIPFCYNHFIRFQHKRGKKSWKLLKNYQKYLRNLQNREKNSFLAVKELKDKGVPVVGAYCTYFPQEIALAMGAATVGLCSTSDETISEAEKDLTEKLMSN